MKSSSKSTFKKNINKKAKLLLDFLNTVPGQITKLVSIIAIVIFLSWSLTNATSSEFESAKDNFSMIGKVSSISGESIDIIDARKSGSNNEDSYVVNIEFVNKIETSKYVPLIASDIKPGYTIIVQGVTNGNKFFAIRIISFSDAPLPGPENFATSTPDNVVDQNSTSTEEINVGDSSGENSISTDTNTQESTSTSENIENSSDTGSSTSDTNDSNNPTISEIIEDGVETVVDIIGSITDIITGSNDSDSNTEPQPEPTSSVESNTTQEPISESEPAPAPEPASEPQQ